MTHRVSGVVLAVAGIVAGAAHAGVPDASHSTIPPGIHVVGNDGTNADASGRFDVIVRDALGLPVPGAVVSVDFSNANRTALCLGQPTGMTLDCAHHTVSAVADAQGRASLLIEGAGTFNAAGTTLTGPEPNLVHILADGVALGDVTAAVWDLDGACCNSGLSVTDLSWWLHIQGTGWYFGACDYNLNGTVEVIDLSLLERHIGDAFSFFNCGPGNYCMP